MRCLNARNFLALYLLSVLACDGQKPKRDASVGRVAEDAGGESTGPTKCEGLVENWLTHKTDIPREVQVQCYVAPAVGGKLDCRPASDPTVVSEVADYIWSSGFQGEFVIAADENRILPNACQPLAQCCANIADMSARNKCFDLVDGAFQSGNSCIANSHAGECNGVQEADDDAGLPSGSQSFGLCCYRVCGHFELT